jgi:hypothetical protein
VKPPEKYSPEPEKRKKKIAVRKKK